MPLAGCNAKEADAYASGIKAISDCDYDTALALFDKALVEGEGEKNVYRGKAIASMGKNDYVGALDFFEKSLQTSNGIVDAIDIDNSYYMSVAMFKLGKYDDALNTLEAITAIRPDSDTAYYLKGKINLYMGNKDVAIANYDKATEIAPGNYDHYVRICEDLREAGYKQESDLYIEKAMSAGNKLSDYRRGVLEYYMGSYTEARNDLENAKKKETNDNLTLYLGRTYEELGDPGYATSLYEEAIAGGTSNSKIYNQLALAKMQQKDYEGALNIINLGIESGDGEALQGLLYNKVVAYEYMYDFDNAKKCMQEYIDKYPDDENAFRENTFLSTR